MLSSLPPPALPVNLHVCTCARARAHTHTHTHTRTHTSIFRKGHPFHGGGRTPSPSHLQRIIFPKKQLQRGRGLASCGRGQVAKGVAGSDGRGGGRVASLALKGQVPGPKPQVLQGEFLSSFSTRFIICLLRPALWENRPSRRQHQALRVKAGMGAQWQWRSGASYNIGSALEALTGSVDG